MESAFDAAINLQKEFPILDQQVYEHPLAYLDNAATSQKPQCVIDAISQYYLTLNSNVHRGIHELSERSTKAYEGARDKVRDFLNAKRREEVIFVSGVTEAINLVASTYGVQHIGQDDEIIVSMLEHHANIVPWQLLCERTGAKLKVIPINPAGELMLDAYQALFSSRTKLVAVGHVSNAIGTINPVKEMATIAHQHQVPILVDGAQAAPHFAIDVQDLDCDFYAVSSHKMYGPTGIGALYVKHDILATMPPYKGGGDMISQVSFEGTTYNELPYKFEAGTPNIAGAIGFGAAIDFINRIGFAEIERIESALYEYASEKLSQIEGLTVIGTAKKKVPVFSFTYGNIHPHDIGTITNSEGVAIRAGHHCAMPLMTHFGISGTARASIAFYNTRQDIDRLVVAIEAVKRVMG